jgi:hypothetical protein
LQPQNLIRSSEPISKHKKRSWSNANPMTASWPPVLRLTLVDFPSCASPIPRPQRAVHAGQDSPPPALYHSAQPTMRTATRLSSPKSCPT